MSASKGNSFCTKMTVKNWWSSLCTSYRWSHEALLLQCSTHCPFGKSEPLQSAAPYPTSSLQYVNILAIANVLIINKSLSPCSISNFIHQKRLPFASAISCPKCFLFSGMVLEHGVPSAYQQELLKNVQKDWCALPMFQMFKNIDNVSKMPINIFRVPIFDKWKKDWWFQGWIFF